MSGFFKGLCKLPFLGRLIQSLNAYVADGEPYALVRFARVKNYLKLLKELCAAFVITLVVYFFFPGLLDKLGPGAFIRDSYADLLGFAIGVYALFFVIPERLITLIEKNKKAIGFGPEIIAAEMFYPLVVLTSSWAACFFLAPFEEIKFVLGVELFLVTYGFLLVLELLGGIYVSSIALVTLYKRKPNQRRPFKNRIKKE
ncbi:MULTISPECIES: hypothetical protein [Alteromonas]|jgi:hypothetical protein|uniref:hypothetical protein n=1 Tax=Alteromonas TaxID=226 RepID=UPI002355A17D|nr:MULTISPECIES: hypothetical protein [Alteromonas]MDY6883185.1 hypothetical protein [Pseudomonadota bacterium]MEC9429213.1 hypothetical protein [Pseudomonadota bacterium]|tara:strand:+ start:5803 stop:6402 length:600 start_codon:yes stop_codon:yes gene_type:complete